MSLCTRLSTIRRQSWHYRLVTQVHKILSVPLEIKSALQYWLGLLPFCLIMAIILGGAAIIIAAALLFECGWLALTLVTEPLHSLKTGALVVICDAGGLAAVMAVCMGLDSVTKKIQRRCPVTIE